MAEEKVLNEELKNEEVQGQEEFEISDTTNEENENTDSEFDVDEDEGMDAQQLGNVKDIQQNIERKLKGMSEDSELNKDFIYADYQTKKNQTSRKHIIPIKDRPAFKTDAEKHRESFQEVYDAWRAGRILTGTITLVDIVDDMATAIVFYNNVKILIPLPLLVSQVRKSGNVEASEQAKIDRRTINERIGSEIDFIVKQLDENEMVGIASRVEAMQTEMQAYFIQKRRGKYVVNEGDLVEGRVCYVTKSHLCVEFCGVEKTLREEDCLWVHVTDLREKFEPGQYLPVKITKLERQKKDGKNILVVNASIKEAVESPKKKFFDSFSKGTTAMGQVTYINKSGVFVKIIGMDYDILCSPPREFATPPVGKRVLIGIHSKNEEDYSIYGYILRVY